MSTPISVLLDRKGSVVRSVAPGVTVAEAVAEMNLHRIGCVLVMDGAQLTGIFTERDVLRRVVGAGLDPQRGRVTDVMTAGPITVSPAATVDEVMALFTDRRCRHLPVVAFGRVVGLISIGDVTRWMVEEHRAEAEHLKNYISGGFSS